MVPILIVTGTDGQDYLVVAVLDRDSGKWVIQLIWPDGTAIDAQLGEFASLREARKAAEFAWSCGWTVQPLLN